MNSHLNKSATELQSKLQSAKSLCLDLLLPKSAVLEICADIGYKFRNRTYNPMVDGWTVTMADTKENQKEYRQMSSQKPGCGFPIARIVRCVFVGHRRNQPHGHWSLQRQADG